jgi:hypothetical protein
MIATMLRSVLLLAAGLTLCSASALVACGDDSGSSAAGAGGQDAEISTSTGPLACDDEPCSPNQTCLDCGGGEGSFQCVLNAAEPGFFLCGTTSCLDDLDVCIASASNTSCLSYFCDVRSDCAGGDPCDCLPPGCTECQVDANGQVTYGCG